MSKLRDDLSLRIKIDLQKNLEKAVEEKKFEYSFSLTTYERSLKAIEIADIEQLWSMYNISSQILEIEIDAIDKIILIQSTAGITIGIEFDGHRHS